MGKRQQLQAAAEGKGGEEGEISDSGGWQRNLQIDIDPLVLLNHDDRTFRSTSHKGTYEGNIHPDQTHTHDQNDDGAVWHVSLSISLSAGCLRCLGCCWMVAGYGYWSDDQLHIPNRNIKLY